MDTATVSYQGEIVKGSFQALLAHLTPETTTLRVRSSGGDGEEAMLIGNQIIDQNLSLVVDGYCMSSCANYLFLAARKKSLLVDSVLGFHGAVSLKNSEDLRAQFELGNLNKDDYTGKEGLKRLQISEWELLKKVDLNLDTLSTINAQFYKKMPIAPKAKRILVLTIDGKRYTFDWDDRGQKLMEKRLRKSLKKNSKISFVISNPYADAMYFPSLKFLQEIGVQGILDYPYPESNAALPKLLSEDFSHIKTVGDFPEPELVLKK
ncbi:hypothetical protein [Undibacterium amnicola]|uniref:hypothetical protein n=1 Tax=Undibacterium amnicola TaxID=1834038 RepID=UPI001C9AA59C|nr:hypothetical protein [Undibacterium amnicola]